MYTASMIAAAALLASVAAHAQQPAPHGNPQRGRVFALHHCDACHIVAADQQFKPLVPGRAPSFQDVADRPGTTADSLTSFLTKPHPRGQMPPNPELTPAQVADLVSYILSLRSRH
jgi:mono/diheme cytochrome c family protein